MLRALRLAERGRGKVSPNPMVGCVVVRRGRAVGEGWHSAFGGPHAEIAALRRAGSKARGATLYVTLEPCAHWGKTPPCAPAVAQSGVRRVVAAMKDPHARVRGKGFSILRDRGIRLKAGVLHKEARFLNRAFIKNHELGLPYVIYKTGQTLDGKIASRTGRSRWITGPEARDRGHRLRAESDAVLVGGETVRKDNPVLSSHGKGRNPLRLVLSRSLRLPPRAAIFRPGAPTWVITDADAPDRRRDLLRKSGAQILTYSLKNGLRFVLKDIFKLGVSQLLLEGGGEVAYSFFEAGLVDETYAFVAPRFLGGRQAPASVGGTGWPHPQMGPALLNPSATPVGRDFLFHGWVDTPFTRTLF
jgi:diaminohydroxyphosphoribosylaminopyrimidine deaminase / 5-amino-6-(5-phosphoribosylamino)uracil reductase